MRGETVTVISQKTGSKDPFGGVIGDEIETTVSNVLIAPASAADLPDGIRPAGDFTKVVAYFPKTYRESLRNCHLLVRGVRYRIVGNPVHYTEHQTPTDWDRVVYLELVEG